MRAVTALQFVIERLHRLLCECARVACFPGTPRSDSASEATVQTLCMSGGAALLLYRQLLRASRNMPTRARAEFVRRAARREFEHNKSAAEADVAMLLRLAEVQLDAVIEQAAHLTALHDRGHLRED